jgi:SnoaL-like domain
MNDEHSPVSAADYLELFRLVNEIAWRIDHGRADTVWQLFTPTGTLDSSGDPLVGQDEIRRWGEERSQSSAKTRHICSGMKFDYDGPDKAVGSTLLTVFIGEAQTVSAAIPSVVGEDHDEFVRTAEGWRFASRRFEVLFRG